MSPLFVYLIIIADNVKTLLVGVSVAGCVLTAILLLIYVGSMFVDMDKYEDMSRSTAFLKRIKSLLISSCLFLFISSTINAAIPSTSQLAAVALISYAASPEKLDIVESESIEIYKLGREWLESAVRDAKANDATTDGKESSN